MARGVLRVYLGAAPGVGKTYAMLDEGRRRSERGSADVVVGYVETHGRPKTAAQLTEDVQLSLYAVGAREAWRLEASRQAYYYLLDDQKVEVPADEGNRGEWVQEVAMEVAEGILSQGFEPTPSFAACSMCDYRLVCPAAER